MMTPDDVIDAKVSWQRDYDKWNWNNFESKDLKKIIFLIFCNNTLILKWNENVWGIILKYFICEFIYK